MRMKQDFIIIIEAEMFNTTFGLGWFPCQGHANTLNSSSASKSFEPGLKKI